MDMNMNDILGADVDKCLVEFKKLTKGELVNLTQLLKIQYEQVSTIKGSILILIESHEKGENKMTKEVFDEHIKAVDELYLALQLIEDRYNIANELLEDLNKQEKLRVEQVKKDIN